MLYHIIIIVIVIIINAIVIIVLNSYTVPDMAQQPLLMRVY